MVLFFTATLVLSIVGLVSLIGIKQWELSTGGVMFAQLRPRFGRASHTLLVWVERVLPALARVYARRGAEAAQTHLHRSLAQMVLTTEGWLEKSLHTLRYTTEHKPSSTEVSSFLREVAEHKKQLQDGRIFDTISEQ
jgi:hypothetical protein